MLFSPKFGIWFSLMELPHAILGVFLLFVLPIYLLVSWGGMVDPNHIVDFVLWYLLFALIYVYPLVVDPETYKRPIVFMVLPVVFILMEVLAIVEFFASHKALIKYFSTNRESWDKLKRVGIGEIQN